jgi:hypothetical protein
MDFLNEVHWSERIYFACAGRAPALIHPAHRTIRAKHDGAAGERVGVVCMSNENTRNVGDGIKEGHKKFLQFPQFLFFYGNCFAGNEGTLVYRMPLS